MIIDLKNYKAQKQQEKDRKEMLDWLHNDFEQLIEEIKGQDQEREQEIIRQYKEFYKGYNQNII